MRERVAEQRAAHRVREVEAIHRARDAHVREAPLLFEFREVREGTIVREHALFETAEEDDRELEALGGVQRHQGDERRRRVERVEIAHERDVREEIVERTRVLLAFELLGDAHELLKVLEPRLGIGGVFALQFADVAGLFHHGDQEVADGEIARAFAQRRDQVGEAFEFLLLLRDGATKQFLIEHGLTNGDAGGVGRIDEARERLLADRTARHVHDAPEGHRVRGVHDVAQVRHHVLAEEAFFEHAGLRVRAVENEEVAVGRALAHEFFDLLDRVARFGPFGFRPIDGHGVAGGAVREDLLLGARRVLRDDFVRDGQDRLRRAVVLAPGKSSSKRRMFL